MQHAIDSLSKQENKGQSPREISSSILQKTHYLSRIFCPHNSKEISFFRSFRDFDFLGSLIKIGATIARIPLQNHS